MNYIPLALSSKSLHVLLGYVNAAASCALTSPPNLTQLNLGSSPGLFTAFLDTDVGCIVQVFGAGTAGIEPNVTMNWNLNWSEIDPWSPTVNYTPFPDTNATHRCAAYYGSRTYECLVENEGNFRPDINPTDWLDITDQWWQFTDLQEGEYLTVTYVPQVSLLQQFIDSAVCAARAAIEAGTGEYDSFSSTDDSVALVLIGGENLARFLTKQYNALSQEITVQTYRKGLKTGQSIVVKLPELSVDGSYIVQSIELTDGDGMSLWRATLVTGAVIGDWRDAIKIIATR